MKLSKNAILILKRFLKSNESIEYFFRRVAKDIAKEDKKYTQNYTKIEEEFYKVMINQEFLPNLPNLVNAGKGLQQLAACFVIPIKDSIESIFQAVKDMALIQKSGGGCGFNFSKLRPEGSKAQATGGIASGPVSFMKVFDATTGAIREGGIRSGGNIGILNIEHPEIEKFIKAKENKELQDFNLSVALTDEFMQAVIKNKKFNLKFKNKIYKTIKARKIFYEICKHAWTNGDPGIIFIDEINRHNSTPKLGKIEAVNTCGEQILLPYESCILGSINLSKCINNNHLDYNKLKYLTQIGVHFLDNSIDATIHPTKQTKKIVEGNRKIGLGVMGFADLLIQQNIPYDSKKAEELAKKIMSFIQKESRKTSQELAIIRGSFPNINQSVYKNKKLRNTSITTIAPTGTISIFANCSAGIEPIFAKNFKRHTKYGTMYESNSSIRTAHDIPSGWHVRIQAAFQKYTDNAISKTVNLPEKATVKDIEKIYLLAYKLKCKGLTVYRYNSRKDQVLEICKKCKNYL